MQAPASDFYGGQQSDFLPSIIALVYDLGGGTFDVALVKITEGELTVVDHEGDNYLGGSDFDALVVEMLIVPEICRRGSFSNLLQQMKSEKGKYNALWYRLLHAAEMAKVELSTKTSARLYLPSPSSRHRWRAGAPPVPSFKMIATWR